MPWIDIKPVAGQDGTGDWWRSSPLAQQQGNTATSPDFGSAISAVESGGNYRAVGPVTADGDRALGKYQIMTKNIRPWSKEILGEEITPTQFMASPDLQDRIFQAKFGSYVDKYGPEGAAKAWFAGEKGMNNPNARDVLGTTVGDYAKRFSAALGGPSAANAAPSDSWWQSAPLAQKTQSPTLDQRFSGVEEGERPDIKEPMLDKAQALMRGPAAPPAVQMNTEAQNVLPAAMQGTSPNIGDYRGKLVSSEVFQDDSGAITYRNPQTGQIAQTDSSKHVAIRDPADGKLKVFDRSDATNENGAVGVARVLAPGLAAGAPTARPAIAAAKNVQPTASDIMATAKPYYRAFKNQADKIEVPQETATGLAERLRGSLDKVNLTEEMAGPAVNSAIKLLDNGKVTTLDDLQKVKRMAGRAFNSAEKDHRDAASVVSAEVGKIIGQISSDASDNLKTGDAIFSTARSVQDLQRKSDVAGLRAGRAGYGGNSVNSMRQVLSPIVQRSLEGKLTGFRPDEVQAMRDIVEGTTATNTLRGIGQLSPSKGIIQTAANAGAVLALGPSAAAIPAIGMASNKLATILTGEQISRLKTLVAKRSPAYAAAVSRAVERYSKAQEAFSNDPSPARFAAYLSSSRALSAGLQRDGLPITSGLLLQKVAGQQPATAEE